MTSGTSDCPNEIVADLRMPPHVRQGGSSSPAATRASAFSMGARLAAAHARDLAHGAVHLDHEVRVGTRLLMQLVDVLRHHGVQLAGALEIDDRPMSRVRLRVPCRRVLSRAPGLLPHLGITHVVLQRRRLLGRRVLRPDAVRPAEVGDARVGRDARAGEHHDALRVADCSLGQTDRRCRSRHQCVAYHEPAKSVLTR